MDGTENRGDTSQGSEDTSRGGKETSETPGTFTKESQEKAVSDALSVAGRTDKDFTDREGRLTKREEDTATTRKAFAKDQEEAAVESLKDDPEALKVWRLGQATRVKESDVADRETKVKEREDNVSATEKEVRIIKRTQLASEIAVEKKVNVDSILKLAKEDSREAMEAVADELPKIEGDKLLPSSSRISGEGGVKDLTPGDKVTRALEKLKKNK